MQFLIDFFEWIGNLITSLFDFFLSLVSNLAMLVEYLGVAAALCYNMIATMPGWLQGFATITVVGSLLFMILGRSGGGKHND